MARWISSRRLSAPPAFSALLLGNGSGTLGSFVGLGDRAHGLCSFVRFRRRCLATERNPFDSSKIGECLFLQHLVLSFFERHPASIERIPGNPRCSGCPLSLFFDHALKPLQSIPRTADLRDHT